MRKIDLAAERIVPALLRQRGRGLCLLDSCGVGRPASNRLIAGVEPVEIHRLQNDDPTETLNDLDELLSRQNVSAIFTISYDLGPKLMGISTKAMSQAEPDVYVALFDSLLFHEYSTGETILAGRDRDAQKYAEAIRNVRPVGRETSNTSRAGSPSANFTLDEYVSAVNEIKELIRDGETYQVNLTQQLTVPLADETLPGEVFSDLRRRHPAPFAAFIDRGTSAVVSASPEQFVMIGNSAAGRSIMASPIKGTRPRGSNKVQDDRLRAELLASAKDRAENTMIVDLMRNDLGRICEFGSVRVDELCRLDVHPTLFHLVSDVSGDLKSDVRYSEVVKAVFPCGSITGAPKHRTMEIIDRLETRPRALSMGAIGCRIAPCHSASGEMFEMSVAIRTMVIREGNACFSVGGGITIDSDPVTEYDESMLKAKALLNALNVHLATSA